MTDFSKCDGFECQNPLDEDLFWCKKCQNTRYCSRNCRKKSLQYHEKICQLIGTINQLGTGFSLKFSLHLNTKYIKKVFDLLKIFKKPIGFLIINQKTDEIDVDTTKDILKFDHLINVPLIKSLFQIEQKKIFLGLIVGQYKIKEHCFIFLTGDDEHTTICPIKIINQSAID